MSAPSELQPSGVRAAHLREALAEPIARLGNGAMAEFLETPATVAVAEPEYWRLLGYPRDCAPSERALELAAWARRWYAENGRPWVYLREASLQVDRERLVLDGREFDSQQLRDHLLSADARRAMLVAVSAGRGCEEHARRLWQECKPDEYFFLEMFGSAVVEQLTAGLSGRICDLAERDGLMAIPHYSPGYTGWDVADQNKLFDVIAGGRRQSLPEPFEVLSSGMLRPKKSLLAVVGLGRREALASPTARLIPCEACGFSPCQYRRAPYRHARASVDGTNGVRVAVRGSAAAPLRQNASYSVSARALRKWADERVQLEPAADGSVRARFRFDGTTCSNLGRPLAFDYAVELSPASAGYVIRRAHCQPAAGDEGHRFMCAYLADAPGLMSAIASETPLLGRPLDDVLNWTRTAAPSGCHCTSASRAHKWGLALEAIHYTLAHRSLSLPPP